MTQITHHLKVQKNVFFANWKKGQKLLNTFWRKWRDEYLLSLPERTQRNLLKVRKKTVTFYTKGDVVLVKEAIPRGCWCIGKIVSFVQSQDG